jgi:hypothetical protein
LKRALVDDMRYEKSLADPRLYFSWNMTSLIIWLSWKDDYLVVGEEEGVLPAKKQ